MALTVTDDMITIRDCDIITGAVEFNTGTNVNNPAVDSDIKVQGTGSWRSRVTGASLGGVGAQIPADQTLIDYTNGTYHISIWGRTLDLVATTDGWRMRFGPDTNTTNNYAEIGVGDAATPRAIVKGFYCFVGYPFSVRKNTAWAGNITQTKATGQAFALLANHTTSSSRDTMFFDEYKVGSGITVTGGTAAPRGSPEIASDDESVGRGWFNDINGTYYVKGRITIGDVTASTNSTFEDSNKTWVFEPGTFLGDFHRIIFVGGTGTNRATFGVKSGTGINEAGAGGNTFLAGGTNPFSIMAKDADIDVQCYGCNFLGPDKSSLAVGLFEETSPAIFNEDNSASSFTDLCAENARQTGTQMLLFPASPAVNDAIYFGTHMPFAGLFFDMNTAGNQTNVDLRYEYWNGGAWAEFNDLTVGNPGFQSAGNEFYDTWEMPNDWATTTVNGEGPAYYVRIRNNTTPTTTTNPSVDAIMCLHSGHFHIEQTNAEFISGQALSMGPIHIRNGGVLKGFTINSPMISGKQAAIEFGPFDPAADTVRDLTISNAKNAIHVSDFTRNLDAGAAVDKGGGLVGIPSTGHGWTTGQSITIAGTTNYNNTYTLDATTSVNEMVITETFTAETFAATDTAVPNQTYNLRAITLINNNQCEGAYRYDDSQAVNAEYTDITDVVNSASTIGDIGFFPTTVGSNDAFYIGSDAPFNEMRIDMTINGAGTYTLAWEYWNGSAWTAVSGLTDGSSALKAGAGGFVTTTWTRPTNWVPLRRGDTGSGTIWAHWLRIRYVSGTMTTNPVADQIMIPGDIRVNYPATSTVTFNILDQGTTPVVDNINGSTINIVNAVTVKVTVLDSAGSAIQNARVLLEADTGGDLAVGTDILTGLTDVNGEILTSGFNFTNNQPVTGRVRKSTSSPFYKTSPIVGTITANGFDITIQMIDDE